MSTKLEPSRSKRNKILKINVPQTFSPKLFFCEVLVTKVCSAVP